MAFSPKDRETHQRMLKAWVETLRDEGYKVVSAALPEYVEKPKPVCGGPVPDLVAKDTNDFAVIGQVKTADDINNAHTRWQLRNYHRIGSKVMLLVPGKSLEEAVDTLASWECGSIEVWSHIENGS